MVYVCNIFFVLPKKKQVDSLSHTFQSVDKDIKTLQDSLYVLKDSIQILKNQNIENIDLKKRASLQ